MLLHLLLLLGSQKKGVTSAEQSLCQFLSGPCCSRAAVGPCSWGRCVCGCFTALLPSQGSAPLPDLLPGGSWGFQEQQQNVMWF